MPNKHAAIKDLRKNRKHAAHNERIKRNLRHLLKTCATLIEEGKTKEAEAAVHAAQQAIDKAAKRGVIEKNKASRKKSTLMKAIGKKKISA
jgi:small subunit ribosomal protein S20